MNEHDTASCILNLIKKHYAQALRENAIRILGSVDFLGNPLGFVVDFKESLTNVLSNGQVTDFVFSVTNSVANSVSKFSGFLSDELNELTLDERHRETRDQIRNVYNNGSIDHFVGGALGFAVGININLIFLFEFFFSNFQIFKGIVGGALSLATQTYRGFYENGVSGAFAGLGKGAVGTVSKPIVGMLDFTNGIASAIRETSKTSYKMEVARVRESRVCATPGALLTPFSRSDAEGQKTLYQVNSNNLNEKYISMEQLTDIQTEATIVNNKKIFLFLIYIYFFFLK
jgi:vacuolar protein sorting-associated protein 13D